MAFGIQCFMILQDFLHRGELPLQPLLFLVKSSNSRQFKSGTRNRWRRCLRFLFGASAYTLHQIKPTPHEGVAPYLINHLSPDLVLQLHAKLLENQGQQKPISQIMPPVGCGYTSDVTNHDGWEIDWFTPVHQIHKPLVHRNSLVSAFTSWNHILNEKPKEQLVKWQHVTLLHSHRVLQP